MYFRQPKYYSEFKCIGPECTANCCYGWRIDWKKDEIDKVKNAPNCSAELKKLIENSFIFISEDKYQVVFDERGKCPCVTEDGLCRIQKELGAEYLSKTCMYYPRYNTFSAIDGRIYRGCNLSCKEIVKKLVNDERATELVNIPIKDNNFHHSLVYSLTEDELEKYPHFKYCGEIFEFFYELIGDKRNNVETNIILGALAAQKLTQLTDDEQFDRIPDALKAFRKQIHNAGALKSIDSIKPNYNVKFGIAEKIIEKALVFRMTDVIKDENGELDVDRYLIGEAKLNEMMEDKPFWLRNIALSLLLELGVIFKSKKHSIFENYSFFVAAISCLKLNVIAAAFAPEKIDIQTKGQTLHFEGIEKIYGLTGIISRRIFQSQTAFNNITKVLSEFDMDSPAYLALLVK